MRRIMLLSVKLLVGLFTCAVGVVMTINGNLGLAPWDVFHQGLSNLLGITIGRAYIAVGIVLIVINSLLGEKIGWGTFFNMLLIGIFIDFLMLNNLIPIFNGFIPRIIMVILGTFVLGFGCYLYISVGLGSGPRDGLMVALVKKTNKSIRLTRTLQEIIIVIVGYILGGIVGIGTLIMATTGGYLMQLAFKIAKFDVKEVEHRFIDDDIKFVKERLVNQKLDG